jgi:hypothetical protein
MTMACRRPRNRMEGWCRKRLSALLHSCCTKAPNHIRGLFLCSTFHLQTAGFFRVGLPGLEPGTSSLSEKRSNRLSYRPLSIGVYKARRRDNVQHGRTPDKPIEDRRGGK